MIPNIFVSSTIADLQHLRDAIRETILELGYRPIMSDHGDIGYLPTKSAEDSCYGTMSECQIAVLIIGKRYGSKSQNDLSITHNEFRKAKDQGIPTISIIDQEVLSFKRVYDANIENEAKPSFPGMDSPEDTFSFIKEIMDYPTNNGILPYDTATKAKQQLKRQIAQFFGSLLTGRFDPIKAQVTDVLSEIKTLRHELLKDKGDEPIRYLRATKFILSENENTQDLRGLSEQLFSSIDTAIPKLLECSSFDEFVKSAKATIEVVDEMPSELKQTDDTRIISAWRLVGYDQSTPPKQLVMAWTLFANKRMIMNKLAKRCFDIVFHQFKKETTL